MAQQWINTGTTANDGTGEPLRDAFNKTNINVKELYSMYNVGSSGTSGKAGSSGTSGTSGISGTSGTSGSSGTSGISGTSGESGTSGSSGTAGTSTSNEVIVYCVEGASTLVVGNGVGYFTIPTSLNGLNITSCHAKLVTAGAGGNPLLIQLANVTGGHQDILSTKLMVNSGETDSSTAATTYVINTSYDDVATNDLIRIDIDQISTACKGLIVRVGFG
jgi:hypothetical protein